MRANLNNYLARLAIIALVMLGGNVRLVAHDLPADRSLNKTLTSDGCMANPDADHRLADAPTPSCVANSIATLGSGHSRSQKWSQQAMSQSILRQMSPTLAALAEQPKLWKSWQSPLASLSLAWQNATCMLVADAQPSRTIAVSRPDMGSAPCPKEKSVEVHSQRALAAWSGEVYMPYDFRLSDWRFGQFPYHAKTATAPRPRTLPASAARIQPSPAIAVPSMAIDLTGQPSRHCAALGSFLLQMEQWQCAAYGAFSDGATLTRGASLIGDSITKIVANVREAIMSAQSDEAPPVQQPTDNVDEYRAPQFVIYESTAGGHIVLTLAQAHAWESEASRLPSRLHEMLETAFNPIQVSVLASASSQLERAGHTLLKLSHSLSSFSASKVATRSQPQPK